MAVEKGKLNGINVQTARMLEIYSLLISELERGGQICLSAEDRGRLSDAIRSIADNMQEIRFSYTECGEKASGQEKTSASDDRTKRREKENLDEIVNAVLKWHTAYDSNE